MDDKKDETLNSLNEEIVSLNEEIKTLDSENDEERISEINEKINSLNDEISSLNEDDDDKEVLVERNKRLYARAKKAEGFVLENNVWIKKPKLEIKPKVIEKVIADESVINKVLDKRELESLDLSDNLKKEIKTYAEIQGISVKKALDSDYISFLKEKEEKKQKIDDASLGSNRKKTKKDYSEMKVTDFDLTTPEGKAEFSKYEEYIKKTLG